MKKFILLALLVVILGAGYGVYRGMNPARVGGTPLAQLPAPEQARRRAEAEELTEKVGEVARAARRHERQPYTLTATEEQLNTLLQDRIKGQNLPISNLRVGLTPGQIILQGDASYKGFSAPATLTGTLLAVDGGAEFKVNSVQVSGLPAPSNWKDKIERTVSTNLDKYLRHDSKVRIEQIEIETGKLTVSGQTG